MGYFGGGSISHEGRIQTYRPDILLPHDCNGYLYSWSQIALDTAVPGSLSGPGQTAQIPLIMRQAASPKAAMTLTEGFHGFLTDTVNKAYPIGHHQYDYRWRTLGADVLKSELGLDVSPVLIERHGL